MSDLILTPEAKAFIIALHNKFNTRRLELLEARKNRTLEERSTFLEETKMIREGDWTVAPTPGLEDRRVEITGPVDAKMVINALNSGANVFMADFEDSSSPTPQNMIAGQENLYHAVRGTLSLTTPKKSYSLNDQIATLFVRARGLHLNESSFEVNGEQIAGSLFDFGLYFFHNAQYLIDTGRAPYFYLPKLEHYQEAVWWNDVISFAQETLGIAKGTTKATVLIETITAALQMEEIVWALRDHSAGLNAGRWDYIFSVIKNFPDAILPDRSQVTMEVPFMKAYARRIVDTCHKRGAWAMGGMSAFIPNRKDPEVTEAALTKIKGDKLVEAEMGFDGTWVAHPDLIQVARNVFDRVLGGKVNQKDKVTNHNITAEDITTFDIEGGSITEEGFETNIDVALQYINYWLQGRGAVALYNLMEDAATAEISRAQLWQWIRNSSQLTNGQIASKDLYQTIKGRLLAEKFTGEKYKEASEILDQLVLEESFETFLTLPAYKYLIQE